MNYELLDRLEKSSAHTQNRLDNASYILKNIDLLDQLISFSFATENKLHIIACSILVKVFEMQFDLAIPY